MSSCLLISIFSSFIQVVNNRRKPIVEVLLSQPKNNTFIQIANDRFLTVFDLVILSQPN